MNYIDLRSDSVTQPTQEMREAMYTAPVGDDGFGEDPTVKNLEKLCAAKVGKEAGLFVPSGTMGNQIAVMTHTFRGDEMIVSSNSHIIVHEVGAAAVLSGIRVNPIECKDDKLTSDIIKREYLKNQEEFSSKTSLICLENALSNGKVMTSEEMKDIYNTAKMYNMPVHLDGARLFNSAVSLNIDVKDLTKYADSVMVCLSKGLCAPVGSVLCGDEEFIKKARKKRHLLGGNMAQAGLIAACGIIGIEKMIPRLHIDHENAKYLSNRLAKMKDVTVLNKNVDINLVFFKVNRSRDFINNLPAKMLEKGIKIGGEEFGYLRFITNNDVSKQDVIYVADTLEAILKEN